MVSNFSRSLIGGDVAGLDGLGSTLNLYPPPAQSVIDTLKARVERLVNDAGWWGDAADSFKRRWEVDAITADVLKKAVTSVAGIVSNLAQELRTLEGVLEQAIDEARAAGAPVTPNGDLLPMPADVSPAVMHASMVYTETRRAAMDAAEGARSRATGDLQYIESIIGPPKNPKTIPLSPDAVVTAADLMANLYALPAASSRKLRESIPRLQQERDAALDRWRQARDQARVDHTKIPDDIKADHKATLRALNEANAELDSVERMNSPLTKLFDIRLTDVSPALKGAAEGSRGARFLGDIPGVDIVAGAISTGVLSYDDMQKGDDWTAVPKEGSGQVASIVAGAAAGVAAGAGAVGGAALIGVSGPVIVVSRAAGGVGAVV